MVPSSARTVSKRSASNITGSRGPATVIGALAGPVAGTVVGSVAGRGDVGPTAPGQVDGPIGSGDGATGAVAGGGVRIGGAAAGLRTASAA